MEAKYTSGPWFAVEYAGSFCIQDGPDYEDKDILTYDSLFLEDMNELKEKVIANTKLICAAPEMYEALTQIVEYWNKPQDPKLSMNDHMMHVMNLAEAAIKKATE